MTSYVVGFTTPHSRLESILEEESKEPPNNWEDKHDDGKESDGWGFNGENFDEDSNVHTTDINQQLEESPPCTPVQSTGRGGSLQRE